MRSMSTHPNLLAYEYAAEKFGAAAEGILAGNTDWGRALDEAWLGFKDIKHPLEDEQAESLLTTVRKVHADQRRHDGDTHASMAIVQLEQWFRGFIAGLRA